jgi:DNA-binding XRE family transcriptional regulator
MTSHVNLFAETIYAKRKLLEISQQELEAKLGVSQQSISKWEKGTSLPKISTTKKIAKALDIESTRLLSIRAEVIVAHCQQEIDLPVPGAPLSGKHLCSFIDGTDQEIAKYLSKISVPQFRVDIAHFLKDYVHKESIKDAVVSLTNLL